MKASPEQIAHYERLCRERGGTVQSFRSAEEAKASYRLDREMQAVKTMVEPGIAFELGRIIIILPTETKSEANGRDWKARSRRTKSARRILWEFMAPRIRCLWPFMDKIHNGNADLRVTLTRLGGRELDPGDNLPSSLKSCRDSLAAMLLLDDRDPRLHFVYSQEPGGECGVRIEIEEV